MIKLDSNSVDLIFELSWPVEVLCVRFDEQDLSFENPNIIKCLRVVVRKIDDLVIQVFIVLMSFDDANGVIFRNCCEKA